MARPAKMSRLALYEEAAKAFASRGFGGASIQELADALGVNKSAIYYYCKSKEELLFEISRDAMQRTLERVGEAIEEDGPPEQMIRRAVHAHVASLAETLDEHRAMMTEMNSLTAPHRRQVKLLRKRYEEIWTDLIERGIEAGAFANADTKFVRLGTLGALNWMIHWYRSDDGPVDDMADRLADFVLHGIGIPAAPALSVRRRRSTTAVSR
jgi:TetR/AcrR family transcriptional regulator, cholesterol catabolism regulator